MRGTRHISRLWPLAIALLLWCINPSMADAKSGSVPGANVLILLDCTGSMRTPLKGQSAETCFSAGQKQISSLVSLVGSRYAKVNVLYFPFGRAINLDSHQCLIVSDIEGESGIAMFKEKLKQREIGILPDIGTFREHSILQGLQQVDGFVNTSGAAFRSYPTWIFVITDLDDDQSPRADVDAFRQDKSSRVLTELKTLDGRPLQLNVYQYIPAPSSHVAASSIADDKWLSSGLQGLFPKPSASPKADNAVDAKQPVVINQVSSDMSVTGRSTSGNFKLTRKLGQMFLHGDLDAAVSLTDPSGKDLGPATTADVTASSDNGTADGTTLKDFVLQPITQGDQGSPTNPTVPFTVDVQTAYQPPWWRMAPTVLTGTVRFDISKAALYQTNPQQATPEWLRMEKVQDYSLPPQGSNPVTFRMSVPGNPWKLPAAIIGALLLLALLVPLAKVVAGPKLSLALAVHRPGAPVGEDETYFRAEMRRKDKIILGGDLSALPLPGSLAGQEVAVIIAEGSKIVVRPSAGYTLKAEGIDRPSLELEGDGQFQISAGPGSGASPATVTILYQPNRFITDDAAETLPDDDRDYKDRV